jgi:ribosomal protein S5
MFQVPITEVKSVPYVLTTKYKACRVRLLPASAGTGLKAGSAVRAVLELAGYENILSKIIGSNNKLNNALTTIRALCAYKFADHFNKVILGADTPEEDEEETLAEGEVKLEKGKVVSKTTDEKATPEEEEKKPVKKVPAKK